jgi:hypothetical protein
MVKRTINQYLLTFCVFLYSFHSYSTFLFWLEVALGAEDFGILGILNPLKHAKIKETPKKHLFASFEQSWREKYFKKKQKQRRKSQSRYISRMHGGALIGPIATEVCTDVKITNVITRANFGGCMFRGLVSDESRI